MSFSSILGQEEAVHRLKQFTKKERIPHAFLFSGPEGVGKEMTALSFLKNLFCEKKREGICDACRACGLIEKKIHPDCLWVVAEEESFVIKIEQIRELKEWMARKPYEGPWKAVVLVEAENMNEEAQNSLLKILEEPSEQCVLVLTSADPKRLLDTVRSRCQEIRFGPLPERVLKEILMRQGPLSEKEASHLARLSSGSVAQGLKFKETRLGEMRQRFLKTRFSKQTSDLIPNELTSLKREELLIVLDLLGGWFRDLLLLKKRINIPLFFEEERSFLEKVSRVYHPDHIERILEALGRSRERIRRYVNVKLVIASLWQEMSY